MSLKLMCVTAHPDDECFGFGGTLALAADRGIETCVLCLTDGQAATNRGEAATGAQLGRMRREEFAASCKLLGVTHYELMDYQDARLEFVDFSQAAGRLVEQIRRFKPDVVITFGGEGAVNSHNDHTMVSALATAAFHWAGRAKRYPELGVPFQPKRLFYLSTNFFLPGRQEPLPAPWNVKVDVRAMWKRKEEAIRAHTSQAALMDTTHAVLKEYGIEEFYTLIAAQGTGEMRIMSDLFEGLKG